MATYADFLQKLIALGSKLPQLWPLILELVDIYQRAVVILRGHAALAMGAPPSHAMLSPAETEAEGHVQALFASAKNAPMGAIGDGSIISAIRNAWGFITQNPKLLEIITALLAAWLKP